MNADDQDPSPNRVFLFSGHMIDTPDREVPRFPPEREGLARIAIVDALARSHADAAGRAICSAACGGDLLFCEAVLALGMPLEIYLPFDPPTFAARSVDFAGGDWRARFEAACAASALHVMPDERGPLPEGGDAYEAVNRWMLDAATRFGAERLDFICLWNGQDGDGPGGAQHMMDEVTRCHGRARWLDTRRLWT